MLLPDHIFIGPMRYAVEVVEGLANEEGVPLFGEIEHQPRRIRLNAANDERQNFSTLWHEVFHGACVQAGFDEPETAAVIVGYMALQTLDRNPYLRTPPAE